MSTGNELLTMKNAFHAVSRAAYEREMRGSGWTMLSWLAAVGGIGVGLVLTISGLGGISGTYSNLTHTQEQGIMHLIIGVASGALGWFVFELPFIVQKRDKELYRLETAADESMKNYQEALEGEIASYGIDVSTIVDHTDSLTDNYEFTAARNGEPIDVTARVFNNEIVFMLNGERMQKPVSV